MEIFKVNWWKSLTTTQKFWLNQLLGWSAVFALSRVHKIWTNTLTLSDIIGSISFVVVCVLGSLALRHIVVWLETKVSFGLLLSLSLMSVPLVSVFCSIIALSSFRLLQPWVFEEFVVFSLDFARVNYLGIAFWLGLWTFLYLLITRQRQFSLARRRTIELHSSLKDAQLATIINQINPHFMFDAISNIRGIVLEDKEKARDMLAGMAELFRYSLSTESNTQVPLHQEIRILENFIELCSIQYAESLGVILDVDKNCLANLIPKMLLHSLIEELLNNYSPSRAKGTVKLTVAVQKVHSKLCLSICLTSTQSHELSKELLKFKMTSERLQYVYAEQASLSAQPTQSGLNLQIELPVEGENALAVKNENTGE